MKPTKEQIEACKRLGMTDEEIEEMYSEDEDVDEMKLSEVDNDLTDEQREGKAKATREHSGKYTKSDEALQAEEAKRQAKATAMELLMKTNGITEITETVKGREFTFRHEGVKYRCCIKRCQKQQ